MTDYRSMVNQDSRINLMAVGCRLSVLIFLRRRDDLRRSRSISLDIFVHCYTMMIYNDYESF